MPGRARQGSPKSARSSSGPSANQGLGGENSLAARRPAPPSKQEKESGGIGGWFRSAGDWIGDRWDDVKTGVSNAVDTVGEAWEAWQATDFGYEDGVLTAETDVDEIADLLPEGALGGVTFDRNAGSDNKVKIAFDRQKGVARITSDDLRIAGVQQGGLSTGPVSLQGVSIEIANESDGKASLFDLKDGNTRVSVSVARVVAANVAFQGADGPMSVSELELGAFKVMGANKGEGLPFGEGRSTTGSFSVGNAVLRGVSAAGNSVGEVQADNLGVSLDEDAEQAVISADAVRAADIDGPQGQFAQAQVAGVRAQVNATGDDRMFSDLGAGHARTSLSIAQANATGVDTDKVDARSLAATGVQLDHDNDKKSLAARVGAVDADGLAVDTTPVAASSGPSPLQQVSLDVDQVRGKDLSVSGPSGPAGAGQLDASGLHATADLAQGDWSASAKGLDARALSGAGATVDHAWVSGASASGSSSGLRADVAEVGVEGAKQGGNRLASAQVSGVSVAKQGEALSGSVAAVDARGLHTAQGGAEHVTASKLAGGRADGVTTASVGAAQASGVTSAAGVSAQDVKLADAKARMDAAGVSGSVASVDVRGLDSAQGGADQLSLSQVAAAQSKGVTTASLGSAVATGVHTPTADAKASRVEVTDAKARMAGDDASLDVARLGLSGVTSKQASVGSATAEGLSVGKQGDRIVAHANELDGEQIAVRRDGVTEVEVGRAAITGAGAEVKGTEANLSSDRIALNDFAANNVKADEVVASRAAASVGDSRFGATLGQADVTNLELAGRTTIAKASVEGSTSALGADGTRATHIDAARVSGVSDKVTGASLASGEIKGVDVAHRVDGVGAKVAEGSLTGLSVGDASVASASVRGGAVDLQGENIKGGVDRASVSGVKVGDLASVEQVDATGLRGERKANGDLSGAVAAVDAKNGKVNAGGMQASVASASAERVSGGMKHGKVSGGAGVVAANGVAFEGSTNSSSASGDSGFDRARFLETGLARVDDVDARFSAPLAGGKYDAGPVDLKVQQGTQVSGQVQVRDNKVVGDNTRVDVSKPVDGPLWVDVRGAYVEDNELKARLGGMFDPNVSGTLNSGLGLKGDDLKSLGTYGQALANQERTAASGKATPAKPAKPGSKPSVATAFDPNKLDVDARVGLSGGTVDAGAAQVTLADKAGANTFDVQSRGKDQLVVSFSEFLASALSLNAGGQQVSAGSTGVTDAKVSVGTQAKNKVTGTVGAVRVEDVAVNKGR